MVWARIDDRMPEHPKIVGLTNAAFRLHVTGICYCSKHLTNGALSDHVLPMLSAAPEQLSELRRAGVWKRKRGGWVIHDFLDYNPSKEQVLAERERKAAAGRLGGLASAQARATAAAQAELVAEPPEPPSRTRRSTIRSVGEEEDQLDQDRTEPTMREPDAPPDAPAVTDVASQSLPPTDRSPPPAVQDGGVHDDSCPCGGSFNENCRAFATGPLRSGPPPISDDTRQKIADLLGYPMPGKKINAMFTGMVEWCAGATEADWLELIRKATTGKNRPERTDDGSIREGWMKTTMRQDRRPSGRSVREGAGG